MIKRRRAYQNDIKEHWRRIVDPKTERFELGDFGFYHPHQIKEVGYRYYKSNYVALPQAGAWEDQSKAWRHDLSMYVTGIAWTEAELDDERKTQSEGNDGG